MNIEERNQYLIDNNLLCKFMAWKLSLKHKIDYEDALSCCYEGAISALDKADPTNYKEKQLRKYVIQGMCYKCHNYAKTYYNRKKREVSIELYQGAL